MFKKLYKSDSGDLIVDQSSENLSPGDTAYLNGSLAPTRKYKVGEEQFILISNGKVYAVRGEIDPGLDLDYSTTNPNQSRTTVIQTNSPTESIIKRRVFITVSLLIYFGVWTFLISGAHTRTGRNAWDGASAGGWIFIGGLSFLIFAIVFLVLSLERKGRRRKDYLIAFSLVFLPIIAAYIDSKILPSADNGSSEIYSPYTEYLRSDSISNQKTRVEILKKEVTCFSEITDAEFDLFNVNGFHDQERSSIPGASSWDYSFVVKIDSGDVSKWTEGFNEIEMTNFDDSWTRKLISTRKENWATSSLPVLLARPESKVSILLYKKEGILFKRVVNL